MRLFGFDIVHQFKLLGIHFQNNIDPAHQFSQQYDAIQKDLFSWMKYNLSLLKKAEVIKIIALTKINHIAAIIPQSSNKILQSIES